MIDDKNPIRNGIIVTVVGGIILAILAWIFGGVLEVIKIIFNWVISAASSIKEVYVYVGDYFQSPVTINWGWLWLLCALSVIALWKMLQPLISPLIKKEKTPKPYKPRLDDYKKDVVFNIMWEWSKINGTLPNKLEGFCPNCSTRLIYTPEIYPDKTSFICQNCNRKIKTLDGDIHFAIGTVERQIERRIKTGEWKSIVTHQHNEKTG